MEPWQSWAAALLVTGGLAYYYSRDSNVLGKANRATPNLEQPQLSTARRRHEKQGTRNKSTAPKLADESSNAAATVAETVSEVIPETLKLSKKRKAGKELASAQTEASLFDHPEAGSERDTLEDDDADWARQLDAKKRGTPLTAPSALSKAAKTQNSLTAAPMSSSNRDKAAMSSTKSDILAPTGGDVSDMLEARAAGPSVLRLTGEEKPKKQLPIKPAPVQETKKQRQNRKKVEEQRLVREQQEKERQAMLEKQRRTAREARGEAAKNGLASAQTPTSSAWLTSLQPTNEVTEESRTAPLLDTFEQDGMSTASSNEIPTNVTTPATAASAIDQDVPPEEEQLEVLNEINGWNEVAKGRKGKKKGQAPTPTNFDESNPKEVDVRASTLTSSIARGFSTPTSKPKATSSSNGYAILQDSTAYAAGVKGHPDDSDWL